MKLTLDLLKQLFPNSSEKNRIKYLDSLNFALEKYLINTPARVAAFLAQLEIESGSLHYVEEIASGSAYEHREDLGNLLPEALAAAHLNGSTTGKFYKGHGLIQITGYYNHKQCGEALGIDLINNPKLLCEAKYACLSAAWFWNTHGCNDLADVGLFGAITKKINGGFNAAEERLKAYHKNKKLLGI